MRWSRLPWSLRRRQLALGGGGTATFIKSGLDRPSEPDLPSVLKRLGLDGYEEQLAGQVLSLHKLSLASYGIYRGWGSKRLIQHFGMQARLDHCFGSFRGCCLIFA